MALKTAKNWYKSAAAWVGAAMVLMPSIIDQLLPLQPYIGEDGIALFALVGALVVAARAVKQESVSGRE